MKNKYLWIRSWIRRGKWEDKNIRKKFNCVLHVITQNQHKKCYTIFQNCIYIFFLFSSVFFFFRGWWNEKMYMSYYNLCGMSKEINSLRPKGNKNSLLLNEILAFLPLSTTTINYTTTWWKREWGNKINGKFSSMLITCAL